MSNSKFAKPLSFTQTNILQETSRINLFRKHQAGVFKASEFTNYLLVDTSDPEQSSTTDWQNKQQKQLAYLASTVDPCFVVVIAGPDKTPQRKFIFNWPVGKAFQLLKIVVNRCGNHESNRLTKIQDELGKYFRFPTGILRKIAKWLNVCVANLTREPGQVTYKKLHRILELEEDDPHLAKFFNKPKEYLTADLVKQRPFYVTMLLVTFAALCINRYEETVAHSLDGALKGEDALLTAFTQIAEKHYCTHVDAFCYQSFDRENVDDMTDKNAARQGFFAQQGTTYSVGVHRYARFLHWVQLHGESESTTANFDEVEFDNVPISLLREAARYGKSSSAPATPAKTRAREDDSSPTPKPQNSANRRPASSKAKGSQDPAKKALSEEYNQLFFECGFKKPKDDEERVERTRIHNLICRTNRYPQVNTNWDREALKKFIEENKKP